MSQIFTTQPIAFLVSAQGLSIVGKSFKKKKTVRLAFHADPLFLVCSRLIPYKYPYLDRKAFAAACHPLMLAGHPFINAQAQLYKKCSEEPTTKKIIPCLYVKKKQEVVRESNYKEALRKRVAQDIAHWFRQSQPLMLWLRSPMAFRSPDDWPPCIWPKLFQFDVTPFEVASCILFSKQNWRTSFPVAILIAWCCGMPEELIARLLDKPEDSVTHYLIQAVDELLAVDRFVMWAANPDLNILTDRSIEVLKSMGKWDLIREGKFPTSKNLRQITNYSSIIDPTERYNVIAWSSGEPFNLT